MTLNVHTGPTKFFECLRLEIRFQIKKLWPIWWFYTVWEKSFFEQCDIKSLEFVYQKLVSTRAHKTSCMFLYRYKVTKKINYEFFYGYIEPNWPYTVWNFAKCNSVTFWKFFRFVKFLIKMLIWSSYHMNFSEVKSNDSTKKLASYSMINSII